MADLNEMELPAVWTLARRALAREPAPSLDVLIERLTPTGLLRRTGDGVPTSRHVGPSVRALLRYGVLSEADDGTVSLVDPDQDEAAFRLRIAEALLPIPADEDPWHVREGSGRLEFHLEVAVAWTQSFGANTALGAWSAASDVLDRQFGVDRDWLRDTAPYNALERLVSWLGLAVRTSAGLVPDPTPLLRTALPSLLPDRVCSAQDFRQRTAAAFPWMAHGTIGQQVAERMRTKGDTSGVDGAFPEPLSLALTRLAAEGRIDLVPGDDAASWVLLSFGGEPGRGIAQVRLA
jgi:hypothetical protein